MTPPTLPPRRLGEPPCGLWSLVAYGPRDQTQAYADRPGFDGRGVCLSGPFAGQAFALPVPHAPVRYAVHDGGALVGWYEWIGVDGEREVWVYDWHEVRRQQPRTGEGPQAMRERYLRYLPAWVHEMFPSLREAA